MFEVLLSVCTLDGGACRDMLLPGHEATTAAACEAALTELAPPEVQGLIVEGTPRCEPMGPSLPLVAVADGVLVHVGEIAEPAAENGGDTSNLAVVIGTEAVAVIDTGTARWIGEALWRAIRAETQLPVTHVILTHMHPDHIFGATPLAEIGAQIVGHAALPQALADRAETYLTNMHALIGPDFVGSAIPYVDWALEGAAEIDLGDRVLTVTPRETAHSVADVTITDSKTGILFAGDLIFDRHTPVIDGSLLGWERVLSELITQTYPTVVPGHGAATLPWPEGAEPVERYLATVTHDTRAAIARGQRLSAAIETVGQSEAKRWELFNLFNPRNATAAFAELEWE